jgi:nucleoside phosphorylase
MSKVDILIVTALPLEYEAARTVAAQRDPGCPGVVWASAEESTEPPYLRGTWLTQTGDRLTVALARPTRMGPTATLPFTGMLLQQLTPRTLAMCGVCAGNPTDVALGDVIIAETTYTWDEGKRRRGRGSTAVLEGDHRQTPILNSWLRAAQNLVPDRLPSHGPASVDEARLWLLERLAAGQQPPKHPAFARYFPEGTWQERTAGFREEGVIAESRTGHKLTPAGRKLLASHRRKDVDPPQTLPFAIHAGPMASGNVVVKDGLTWDMLKKFGVRSVLGLEMEAAAIGRAAFEAGLDQWVVVKGVMDHADPNKDDRYKRFAARASAEVLFAFLAERLARPRECSPAVARRVFILGGVTCEKPGLEADRLAFACAKLGGILAKAGVHLVVCSPFPGSADVNTVMGYVDAGVGGRIDFHCPNHPDVQDGRARLDAALGPHNVRIKPFEHEPPVFSSEASEIERKQAWGEAWRTSQSRALQNTDAIIAIGGKTYASAITTLREADRLGLPILPLAMLGGAGQYFYELRKWEQNHPGLDHTLLRTREGITQAVSLLRRILIDHALGAARSGPLPRRFFLSRATVNADYALPTFHLLKERGRTPLLGDDETQANRGPESTILDSVRSVHVFIALWSGAFACSPYCMEELSLAMELPNLQVWIIAIDDTLVTHPAARRLMPMRAGTPAAVRVLVAELLDRLPHP